MKISKQFAKHVHFRNLETEEKNNKMSMTALSAITNLKKLCSHPELIYDKCQTGTDGFEGTLSLFPNNFDAR